MEKEIKNIVDRILSEEVYNSSRRITRRVNENTGMCSECGGSMYEGECMECGNMYEGDIQELGGMDDGHPRFGNKNFAKMSSKEKEDLMSDRSYENNFDDDDDDSLYVDDYDDDDDDSLYVDDYEEDDDESNSVRPSLSDLSRDLSDYSDEPIRDREDWSTEVRPRRNENPRHFDSYKDLDEEECNECGDMYEDDLEERLYGKQYKLDKNKNGRLDRQDFAMLRNRKNEVELEERLYGKQHKIDKNRNNRIDSEDFAMLRRGNKTKVEETYYTIGTQDNTIFTENEMIDIIEKIINEEKKMKKGTVATSNVLKSSLNKSGKEENDYIEMVTKKMKEYLKNGSKGKYEMNPKHFPKGNGELEEMEKMAYIPSDAVKDYTKNLTAAALENLDYDGINPDEEWVTDNIEGSSRTGNNPDWANAVVTDVNKERNKIRKDNILGKVKKQAYNKAPQPIVSDKSGNKVDKADQLLIKLESTEEKKVISEITKMKNLIGYNQKTQ